jgi:hypothetical protein
MMLTLFTIANTFLVACFLVLFYEANSSTNSYPHEGPAARLASASFLAYVLFVGCVVGSYQTVGDSKPIQPTDVELLQMINRCTPRQREAVREMLTGKPIPAPVPVEAP